MQTCVEAILFSEVDIFFLKSFALFMVVQRNRANHKIVYVYL